MLHFLIFLIDRAMSSINMQKLQKVSGRNEFQVIDIIWIV